MEKLKLNDKVTACCPATNTQIKGTLIKGGYYYTEFPFQVITEEGDSYTSISEFGASRKNQMVWTKVKEEAIA